MYGRAINAFVASVMLAERGMTIEAAGAARTIYEVGFWLSFLATDPLKALDALEVDQHDNAIQREVLLREEQQHIGLVAAMREARKKATMPLRRRYRRPTGTDPMEILDRIIRLAAALAALTEALRHFLLWS